MHSYACHIATTDSVKEHKLRKRIAWLATKEAREMEFISLYIPHGKSPYEIVEMLKKESDSAVMKSERVRDRLQDALKSVIQHLKLKKEIPENGLAIFAGTFADDSGNEVLNAEEIVPPEPITNFLYEVDDHFDLEPLREMLRKPRIVGLIAVDSKEAGFGILDGENLELIENITSGIPGKSGKGGQSQRRYERERDMELTYFFQRVAEHAAKAFLENHKVTALIVGGPGPTKDDFLKDTHLNYMLKNALLSVVDTQSAGKEGVKETLSKSSEALKNMCGPEERRIVQRLLTELAKQDGLAVYGLGPVSDALKNGEADVALVTDSTDLIEAVATCKKCGLLRTKIIDKKNVQSVREIISRPCEKCNAVEYEVEEKDIVDVLEDLASQTDARVEVISTISEEKAKLTDLGGFAALLRYKPR
jgi:peptide chain release factor subunit 1